MSACRSGLRSTAAAFVALWLGLPLLTPAAGAASPPGVANPALLRALSAGQQAAVAGNGFTITSPVPFQTSQPTASLIESPSTHTMGGLEVQHAAYWQFSDLYDDNFHYHIPSFITSDALLHTFHVIYDQTLVALERTVFAGKLAALSTGLLDVATYQYGATGDARIREAARLNIGYAAVAARLLDPQAKTPALVAPQVTAELSLIAAHRAMASSPLFGAPVDYSQFVPRGHYTSAETLRRYFLAMTWYGRLQFPLSGPDATLRTRQALLLTRGLSMVPDLGTLWAALFDPITVWVGRSDDLTVRDYEKVAAGIYPANTPVQMLSDDARLSRFIRGALKLPGPQIRGDTGTMSGFRLFGQRFVPDASIMQALIYPHVGTSAVPRVWPTGLDVAATLGSARAATLLTGSLRQQRYTRYTTVLAEQQAQYRALPVTTWRQNLYWGWLDTLRAAWGAVPLRAPAFMKTPAWSDKQLATGLASWAQLRHDTLLYAKQPYGLGGGGAPPLRVVYVEPAPLVYVRLLALTQQVKATLVAAGELDALPQKTEGFFAGAYTGLVPLNETGYRAAIDAYAGIVALAERVSERELLNQTVSADNLATLTGIGALLGILTNFFQHNGAGQVMSFFDKQVAQVADVFTDPNSAQVLEEGVGDVLPIYAVVLVNGARWLARGGVFSYYEFHHPSNDRLTDDAWRRLAHRPGLPMWELRSLVQ